MQHEALKDPTVKDPAVKTDHGIRGFSLIELAIVVTISGLLLAAWIQAYDSYLITKGANETKEKMDVIDNALAEFYGLRGRYPCPANPALAPTDAGYGLEICRVNPDTDPCPGGNIICQLGNRDANNTDGDDNPATGQDPIAIGALPITTLINGIKETELLPIHGYDGWDNKFIYAVSEFMSLPSLTVENPANVNIGALNLVDENNRSILQPDSSGHYMLVSLGRNGKGAWSRDGQYNTDCIVFATTLPPTAADNPATAGIEVELENCDNQDGNFVKGLQSFADGDNYFDDIVYFKATTTQSLWAFSLNTPTGEAWYYNTNLGNVGVEVDQPNSQMEVAGTIRADTEFWSDGNVTGADDGEGHYCDGSGDFCVNLDFLARWNTYDTCPAGQVAVGIERNNLICEPLPLAAPSDTDDCLVAGEFVYAISNLGHVKCRAP